MENFRCKRSKGKFSLNATAWWLRIKKNPFCFCGFWDSKKPWPFKFRKRVTSKQFLLVPKMDVHSWICFVSLLLDSCWDHWANQPKFAYFTSYLDFLGRIQLLGRWFSNAHVWFIKNRNHSQKKREKNIPRKFQVNVFVLTKVSSTWRCDSRPDRSTELSATTFPETVPKEKRRDRWMKESKCVPWN